MMPRLLLLLLTVSLLDAAEAVPGGEAHPFRAGAAVVEITPPRLPVIVNGYTRERIGREVIDRLYARAMVIEDGGAPVAFCVVDTCMMPQDLIDQAKHLAAEASGISASRMMISATHTHAAPSAMGILGSRPDPGYVEWLPGRIAEAITSAWRNLQPASIGWGSIDVWEFTHSRRWIRRADRLDIDPFGQHSARANMHPGYQSPDVVGPSGPVDPGLSVVALRTKSGAPLALLANYSQHYYNAPPLSADYFGGFCREIARLLGQDSSEGPFVPMLSQGTSGDLMWMDFGRPEAQREPDTYAASLARAAHDVYMKMAWHERVPVDVVEKTLSLRYRTPDAERLAWARQKVAALGGKLPVARPEVYAHEAIYLHERQATHVLLQAIRLGDLTISALPNEVYAITGLKLKAQAPLAAHFNIGLANGAEGYIPPPGQHELGGYSTWPARTAGLEVDAEPKIVTAMLIALEEVAGRKRRPIRDEHGPYARAVLDARPVAYWRLNDIAGRKAANAVEGGAAADLVGGVALYLPGAGSGSGIGAESRLTASPFSGPSQINRAIHLAGGHVEGQVGWPGEKGSIALWFWLGMASGASERSGRLVSLADGGSLSTHQDSDHQVQLRLRLAEGAAVWVSRSPLRADDWHFAVIVRDGSKWQVYVDGEPAPVLRTTSMVALAGSGLRFGDGLQGKLDEVAVFDRALAPAEIDALWMIGGTR